MPKDRRVLGALVAVLTVVVAAVLVLVLRDDPSTPASDPPVATPSASATEGHEHEGDPVDEVDPDIDPADYQDFCNAFYIFANAYSSTVADDSSGESVVLQQAAEDFRQVAADTEMTDEVRAGFEGFVNDTLRVEDDATTEEQGAFSTFLNSACPA